MKSEEYRRDCGALSEIFALMTALFTREFAIFSVKITCKFKNPPHRIYPCLTSCHHGLSKLSPSGNISASVRKDFPAAMG